MAALGFGAAAAPVAGQMLAKNYAGEVGRSVGRSSLGMGAIGGYADKGITWNTVPAPTEPWTARGITKMLWDAMHQEAQEAREAVTAYHESGIQGHDPVAFVCKSWSPVFGNSYTRNKLKALQRRAEELETKLWRDPQ